MVRAHESILAALASADSGLGPRQRAMLLVHAARISAALDLFEKAFEYSNEAATLNPSDAGIAYQRARLALLMGDLSLANKLVQECLDRFPGFMEARMLQAQIAMESGYLDVAESCYGEIVAAEPDHARAWAGLAELRRARPGDDVFKGLAAVPESEGAAENRATAGFAIADAHARAGEHPEAFEHYREANQALAGQADWDMDAWEAMVRGKIDAPPGIGVVSEEESGPQPLFIVGMPRSGSSLLERMLGAHPEISTSGERQSLTHIERHLGSELSPEQLLAMQSLYRAGMNASEEACWVCDKANRNFERVGLIQALFPASKIIWIIRNPIDTVLSCYMQDFQHGLAFSHSLDHLARMYIGHWKLMNHWLAAFGDSILPVQYESLVSNPEPVLRFICDFLAVEFDEGMLQPHQQRGVVRTASTLQVQEPINTRSLGRWRNYQDQLDAVIEQLRAENIVDDAGNALLPGGVL